MYYSTFSFSLGKIFLAKNQKGLILAHYIKTSRDFEKTLEFFDQIGLPLERKDNSFLVEKKLLTLYFSGKEVDFNPLPVDFIMGTPFQKKVWQKAQKIPYGKTESYKSLARKMNHRGYRSIGQALSKNPLLIVVPCHRVLASNGSLGGFSAGLKLKKYLLELEKEENPI